MSEEIRIDKRLLSLEKPGLVSIDHINLDKNDVLIVCAGFEDRATACLEKAVKDDKNSFSLMLIGYLPFISENKEKSILSLCKEKGIRVTQVEYDRENPSGIDDQLVEHLCTTAGKVYIDVSGMSRLLIVQLLYSLSANTECFKRSHILYAEALEYPPAESKVDDAISIMDADLDTTIMFLSSGVHDVMVVPELTSVALQGQPNRLIVFPSFNIDQLTSLRAELQPSYLSIIHGIPPSEEYRWRLEKISKLNRIKKLQNFEEHKVCTLDYRKTLEKLLDIYDNYGALEKLIVAPTGSKMQSIAVGLFRVFMEDIQIVFPVERSFDDPKHYTEGVKQIYSLSLEPYANLLNAIHDSND